MSGNGSTRSLGPRTEASIGGAGSLSSRERCTIVTRKPAVSALTADSTHCSSRIASHGTRYGSDSFVQM